jgi:type III secretory pathway component EscT
LEDLFIGVGSPARDYLSVLAYFMPRAVSFMVFFPVFSKGASSTLIKMAVASALVFYPALAAMQSFDASKLPPAMTLLTFLNEVALGGFMGLVSCLPYYVFRGFGALIDVYRGATFSAQVSGNDTGEELPLETLFGYLFAALVLAGPGLHAISHHLLSSFVLMPPGFIEPGSLNNWLSNIVVLVGNTVRLSLLLSMPVLIAVLVVEIAVQIISAFAQQIQVYSIEYGLKSLFGILATMVLLNFAELEILEIFSEYNKTLNTLISGH